MTAAVQVRAPSRLHFGLLSFPARPCWPNRLGQETVPARRFGGAGLMVQAPSLRLTVRPAAEWSAEGPSAGRALEYARRFCQSLPSAQPQRLLVEQCPPEHAGLGMGTQLGLAVASALAAAHGLRELNAVQLAERVGRGARSALGIHGFARGGFLVDAGKGEDEGIAPLVARTAFPIPWRVVLVLPRGRQGLHGPGEQAAFQRLRREGVPLARTDALCRLVLLGLLPGLAEHNFQAFSEALYDFNCLAGEPFATVQGGVYAEPQIAELVTFIRMQGVRGVGQSSWGPTVFAVTEDEAVAADLVLRIRGRFMLSAAEVFTAAACNEGATIEHG